MMVVLQSLRLRSLTVSICYMMDKLNPYTNVV